jgi:hypothetical protein
VAAVAGRRLREGLGVAALARRGLFGIGPLLRSRNERSYGNTYQYRTGDAGKWSCIAESHRCAAQASGDQAQEHDAEHRLLHLAASTQPMHSFQ